MSKAKVIVLSVVQQGLTQAEAARRYDVSWQWVHTLLTRYRAGGLEALEPRSRRPRGNSRATSQEVRARIIELRTTLTAEGLDAGPVTIATHLRAEQLSVPSTSTIRRVLHDAGLVTAQPKKRPRSSLRRFEADQPNECWQSDFTHWQLADGSHVEILDWLDDHSRYLLSLIAYPRVTGNDVIADFTENINQYGPPAATLTDNGSVFTARFVGGKNGFEYLQAHLGIQQKNGHPGHPQTQGKIERFHQTLKKWLRQQPPAHTPTELQTQLDHFQDLYNTRRPHRALNGHTPADAYAATPKATPTSPSGNREHYRIRLDHVDNGGKVSLRRAGRMHHLGVGFALRGQPVIVLTYATTATVLHHATGELLSKHHIDPTNTYWRDTTREPGRWPGSQR
jgi:transposase InsO family protein